MEETRMATADVVERLERERARLLDAVDGLGAGASTIAVTEAGGWTAQDVLAHLIHYAGQIAFGLGAPVTPPPYVEGVTERLSPQQWNDLAVDYWRAFPLVEVRSEFDRVTRLVIDHAGRRTDDQMNATDAMPWIGAVPLWQAIGGDTFLHEWPRHAAQIEAVETTAS
jgi:hypothetical protein